MPIRCIIAMRKRDCWDERRRQAGDFSKLCSQKAFSDAWRVIEMR